MYGICCWRLGLVLMLIAYCLLLIAYYLLHIAHCSLLIFSNLIPSHPIVSPLISTPLILSYLISTHLILSHLISSFQKKASGRLSIFRFFLCLYITNAGIAFPGAPCSGKRSVFEHLVGSVTYGVEISCRSVVGENVRYLRYVWEGIFHAGRE